MRKSIQQMLILALCLVVPSFSRGAAISQEEARNLAAEFFQSGEINRLADKDAFTLAHVATDESQNPVCYVFNAKDGQGFVIVSADDSSMPIIGYSDNSTWQTNAFPDAVKTVISKPVADSYGKALFRAPKKVGEVGSKLLNTPTWSQEAPFNNNIPNRRLTGCVGVAVAEIMKYHSYPAYRPASLVKDGESAAYNWNSMRNDNYRNGYTAEEAAGVATLVADAAIGIGTDFGMSSSSAFEVKVPYALSSLFGYDSGVSYKKRSEMSKDAWDAVIVNEIDQNRPVLYSGQDVSSGHAFVCDGYEKRGNTYYFHINWGWGGSANGYYASDALNPVVSKAHSYNDLTTIVYNIKPAENSIAWSPIHVTSDDRQVGLTLDVADISAAGSFTVRAGALKNISTSDFSGKLSVALFDSNGNLKYLLNDGRNFSLISLQTVKYVDFACKLPSGTSVSDGDVVRLATKASDSDSWLPVAGDLLASGEMLAKGGQIPYFSVSIPAAVDFVEINASDDKVIKGRDYSFKVVPTAAEKVVTVKANGFILTPDASNGYKIVNVVENQKIDIIVQNAADVLSKSTLWLEAGNLKNLLNENETSTVVDLTLFGTMNVEDFTFIRERMKLNRLDISQVNIVASGSNPANAIPAKAFSGYRSLKSIILPSNLTTFKSGCFNQTGLTSVEIPASVATWEYNVFLSCSSLREVIVRRSSPAWINWCVFNGTPKAKLVVPVGASAAYKSKEYWQDFKEIVEENAVAPSTYTVKVQEKKGLNITSVSEGVEFAPGATYSFKVESDDSHGDANMEVYANAARLTADSNGVYSTKVNRNTLIHVEFKNPQPTTVDNLWKITGAEGGVGLVSEVVNVPVGQSFNVRVNAIKVPSGYSSKFFAIVLTTKDGGLKEVLSSAMYNMVNDDGSTSNITYNFNCKVKESVIRDGDQLRLATTFSANEKNRTWSLVEADAEGITDRLSAINNPVLYHRVALPESSEYYKVEGTSGEVVRGMPYSFKVTPSQSNYRVSVVVNGVEKASNAAVANISIPAVTEDLVVSVTHKELSAGEAAADNGYVKVDVQAGQLANKMSQLGWPEKLKIIGSLNANDFTTLKNNNTKFKDLDLSDVKLPNNALPSYSFYSVGGSRPSLRTLILPEGMTVIETNACAGSISLEELVFPSTLATIKQYAFSQSVKLAKITVNRAVPPACNFGCFPTNKKVNIYVPSGSETAYKNASFWSNHNILTSEPPKTSYHVDIDGTKIAQFGSYDLNNIGVGNKEEVVWLALPNVQRANVLEKVSGHCRYGVAFKFYDNGVDMFAQADPSDALDWSWNSTKQGGIYKIYFNPNETSGLKAPANHKIDLDFYYPISFSNDKGAKGIEAQIVNLKEKDEWKNVEMWRFGGEGNPTLYKEGSDIQFKLALPDSVKNSDLSVKVSHKVMTKSGLNPEYEHQEFEVDAVDGIYTIPSLPGETLIKISPAVAVVDNGTLSAEDILETTEDIAEEVTEIILTGDITDDAFEALNEKFKSAEVIDLSGIDNTSIPDGAFAGMENLQTVTLPPTVTEIGANAFEGCENIETLTLPGVTSIGEGAFDGCTHLTSILIPSAGTTDVSPVADGKTKAPSANGISVESFRGLNPNCLIYMGGKDIPDAENLNIILNVDGNRVAASDIVLDGNHPFNAPASFNLGENKISFTVDVPASVGSDIDGGWKGIILPFAPTSISYGVEFADRVGSGLNVVSFDDGNSEMMTRQSAIAANHPYMANVCAPFKSVPVTFSAVGRADVEEGVYDVPFTPVSEETVAVGKNFSLYGSFDGKTVLGTCLALSEDGKTFNRSADGDVISVNPFSAYLCANDVMAESGYAVGEHPLWIFDPMSAASGIKLYRSDKIELVSATPGADIYYTVDGSDPSLADGSRIQYVAPFSLENESMTIKAIAEFKDNVSDIADLQFELKKVDIHYDLAQNWNWISHNMENAVAVSEFASDGVSRIVGQTKEAVSDPKFGLIGNLTKLDPAVAYKVCVSGESWTGSVAGVAFDPSATVKLNRGWNWIGSPVDDASLLVSDLLAGLKADEGDMIVGLEGFAQYDADGAWKGTLGQLVPGVGYMYLSNSDKDFVFNLAPVSSDAPAKMIANDTPWVVDIHRYPSVMPVTARLISQNGSEADASEYKVAAFCGDECRGVGILVDDMVMINVHGNPGDVIGFRFITPEDKEMQSVTEMQFDENAVSTIADPCEINLSGTSIVNAISDGSLAIESADGSVVLKGDVSGVGSLEVYDLSGQLISKSSKVERGTVKVSNLESGIYMVLIRENGTCIYRKVMVK